MRKENTRNNQNGAAKSPVVYNCSPSKDFVLVQPEVQSVISIILLNPGISHFDLVVSFTGKKTAPSRDQAIVKNLIKRAGKYLEKSGLCLSDACGYRIEKIRMKVLRM